MTLQLEGSTFANIFELGEQRRIVMVLMADEFKFTNPRTPCGVTLEVGWKKAK